MPVLSSRPVGSSGNTLTIARNAAWYTFDVVASLVTAFATSIVIARAIGPQKLGYFNYIAWLASISASIGGLGVPVTTRKYMAEYFGRGEPGVCRAIFERTFRLQILTAGVITAVGLLLVFTISDRNYLGSSIFQVASILPAMLTSIPAAANLARENMRANVPSGLVSSLVYISFVLMSLIFGWGLPGIALGFLLGRTSEVAMRLFSVRKWIHALPKAALPGSLRERMRTFSGSALFLCSSRSSCGTAQISYFSSCSVGVFRKSRSTRLRSI